MPSVDILKLFEILVCKYMGAYISFKKKITTGEREQYHLQCNEYGVFTYHCHV